MEIANGRRAGTVLGSLEAVYSMENASDIFLRDRVDVHQLALVVVAGYITHALACSSAQREQLDLRDGQTVSSAV
jgi:hypothetical protein